MPMGKAYGGKGVSSHNAKSKRGKQPAGAAKTGNKDRKRRMR